eukprot:11185774-Lingulodinium_polyedra.AAC.1
MASCIMFSVKPRRVTSCVIVSKRIVPPPGPARRCTALKTMSSGFPWLLLVPGSVPSPPAAPCASYSLRAGASPTTLC